MFSFKETKIKNQISLGIILVSLALVFNFGSALADEISDKLEANQQKLNQINQQIKQYQQQIASVQSKTNTLKGEISIYDKQVASTQLAIDAKQTQIDDNNLQIDQLKKLIAQKNKEIDDNKQILAKLIVELNEFDDQYTLKTTIGSNNLSEFFDQVQYTQNLNGKVYQLVQKIKSLKEKLEEQQKALEIQVKKLEELQSQMLVTKNSLTAIKTQKQKLLNQTQGLEKNYQKLLAGSKQDAENLQKEIEDLDAKIRAKLGNKTISASKGALAWPMDGILTQGYGNTGFTALGYNFHNGIDIAAPAGQPIYSAADGVVINTDRSDASFGNWVAVKHNITTKSGPGQIIAVYAHFQSFKVSVGQQLKQGDLIGYEGNTGNTTKKLYGPGRGYHIHFGIYDVDGFGVNPGAYTKIYGAYKVPYGYTYNPLLFLGN